MGEIKHTVLRSIFSSVGGELSSKRIFGVAVLLFGLVWAAAGSLLGNALMVDVGFKFALIGGSMASLGVVEYLK